METKSALYTTEGIVHILIQVMLAVNTLDIDKYIPGKYSQLYTAIFQAVLAGLYTIGRGVAKNKGTYDPNNANNYRILPRKPNINAR